MLKNSSELQEVVERFQRLLKTPRQSVLQAGVDFALKTPPTVTATLAPDYSRTRYTDEKLEMVLSTLIKRGGFASALLLDNEGLLLAQQGTHGIQEILPALCAVLGSALQRVSELAESWDNNLITVDLNLLDKAVLARFSIGEQVFFLLVVCAQDQHVREELEIAMSEFRSILH